MTIVWIRALVILGFFYFNTKESLFSVADRYFFVSFCINNVLYNYYVFIILQPKFIEIKRRRFIKFFVRMRHILMSSLVMPHSQSFLRKQESRKTKENTGFPLKNCGNDGKNNVLLLMGLLSKLWNRVSFICYNLLN